jgi:probable F420-dependent oxidoreductase
MQPERMIGLDFGVLLYEFGPDALARIARRAEELGFALIACGDHLVLPAELPLRDTARPDFPIHLIDPKSPTARRIFRVGAPMPDPFQYFTYMAAHTTRLEFSTAIFVMPVRHPLVVARSAATFDFLSRGRLTLGLGAGWLPGEFEIAQVPFGERGRRMDEGIRVMRELWEKEEPRFKGEFFSFPPARFEPKPAQRPGIPILIGGESERALRRVAELGDGWSARVHTPQSLREHLQKIERLRRDAGREGTRFIVHCRVTLQATAADVTALRDAGADRVNYIFREPMDEAGYLREMERIAGAVLAKL